MVPLNFEELDPETRRYMVEEFDDEQGLDGHFEPGAEMSPLGKAQLVGAVREALLNGDDVSLADALRDPNFWERTRTYRRGEKSVTQRLNPDFCAEQLARCEFNTWYVRGLCRKLIDEGVQLVEIYRAGDAADRNVDCTSYEGRVVRAEDVYLGHRSRYWPEKNDGAFAIPFHAGCHHSIRRVRDPG